MARTRTRRAGGEPARAMAASASGSSPDEHSAPESLTRSASSILVRHRASGSGLPGFDEDHTVRAAHAVDSDVFGTSQRLDGDDVVRADAGEHAARPGTEGDVVNDIEGIAAAVHGRRGLDHLHCDAPVRGARDHEPWRSRAEEVERVLHRGAAAVSLARRSRCRNAALPVRSAAEGDYADNE